MLPSETPSLLLASGDEVAAFTREFHPDEDGRVRAWTKPDAGDATRTRDAAVNFICGQTGECPNGEMSQIFSHDGTWQKECVKVGENGAILVINLSLFFTK